MRIRITKILGISGDVSAARALSICSILRVLSLFEPLSRATQRDSQGQQALKPLGHVLSFDPKQHRLRSYVVKLGTLIDTCLAPTEAPHLTNWRSHLLSR